MTRHHPLLVPALVAPGLAAAILAASAAIIFTRPAHGQECRFQFSCPFVASVSKAAPERIRYRVRAVGRVQHAPSNRTAKINTGAADDSMPLVWPALDPEIEAPEPLIPGIVRTVGIVPAVFIPTNTRPTGNKPDPPQAWRDTLAARASILSVFASVVIASVLGIVIAEFQKRNPHERRSTPAFG